MRLYEFHSQNPDFSADDTAAVANPGNWSKPIPLDNLINMLRGTQSEAQPQPAKAAPTGRVCDLLLDTLKKHSGVREKLASFLETKLANHMAGFGSKDAHFSGNGNFGGMGIGLKHAHLTHDISVIYRIHGNPPTIDLYGIFRHDESGTGQPPNMNRQKSLIKKISRQEFQPLDKGALPDNV